MRELRDVSAPSAPVRAACTLRAMMTQVTMTRTKMTAAPRNVSKIVPAGGLSKGDEPESCGGGELDA